MSDKIEKGDSVTWNSRQGLIKGKIVKKIVKNETVRVGDNKKKKIEASSENPQVLVKSSKTGKQAVHKPSSIRKA